MEGILITVALVLFTIIIAIVSYMVYNIKKQISAAGIINIRLSKIVIILLAIYIVIHAVKDTKIIDAITKIGEII